MPPEIHPNPHPELVIMTPTYWLITKQNLLLVQPNDNNVPATRNMIIAAFCTWCPSKKTKKVVC